MSVLFFHGLDVHVPSWNMYISIVEPMVHSLVRGILERGVAEEFWDMTRQDNDMTMTHIIRVQVDNLNQGQILMTLFYEGNIGRFTPPSFLGIRTDMYYEPISMTLSQHVATNPARRMTEIPKRSRCVGWVMQRWDRFLLPWVPSKEIAYPTVGKGN